MNVLRRRLATRGLIVRRRRPATEWRLGPGNVDPGPFHQPVEQHALWLLDAGRASTVRRGIIPPVAVRRAPDRDASPRLTHHPTSRITLGAAASARDSDRRRPVIGHHGVVPAIAPSFDRVIQTSSVWSSVITRSFHSPRRSFNHAIQISDDTAAGHHAISGLCAI
jgi:hypothetical protein